MYLYLCCSAQMRNGNSTEITHQEHQPWTTITRSQQHQNSKRHAKTLTISHNPGINAKKSISPKRNFSNYVFFWRIKIFASSTYINLDASPIYSYSYLCIMHILRRRHTQPHQHPQQTHKHQLKCHFEQAITWLRTHTLRFKQTYIPIH